MSKIDRSMYAPRLWFGIEKIYAIIILMSEIILLGLGSVLVKVIASIIFASLWVMLVALNRYDYVFFTVLKRHIRRPKVYLPYTKTGSNHYKKVNYRPK